MSDQRNYYDILGVPRNASSDQIQEAKRRLVNENHPDQITGRIAKYRDLNDPVLNDSLERTKRDKQAFLQLVLEAFDVLSNPVRRADYDRMTSQPTIREPHLVVNPSMVDFGEVTQNQSYTATVIIANHGGKVSAPVLISFPKGKPTWISEISFLKDSPSHPNEIKFPTKLLIEIETRWLKPSIKYFSSIQIEYGSNTIIIPISFTISNKPALTFDPVSLNFGDFYNPEEIKSSFRITNQGSYCNVDISISGNPSWGRVNTSSISLSARQSYSIQVIINTNRLPPGEYHEQVIVSTDNYQFRIPLSFRVVGLPIPAGAVLDEAPVIVSTNIVQSDSDPRNVSPILVQRSQIKPNQTPSIPSNDSNSSSPKKNRSLLERIFWGNK